MLLPPTEVEDGSPSPLRRLPLELVYHTLRLAAFDSRCTALACARVSSDVRRATAPELYHSVVLRRPAQIERFVDLLLDSYLHLSSSPFTSLPSAPNSSSPELEPKECTRRPNPGTFVRNLVITHHVPTPTPTPSSSPFATPPASRPPDRKSTRLNSSHSGESRMPSSA